MTGLEQKQPKSFGYTSFPEYDYQYMASYPKNIDWLWEASASPFKVDNTGSGFDKSKNVGTISLSRPLKYENKPTLDLAIDSSYSIGMSWGVFGTTETNKASVRGVKSTSEKSGKVYNMKILQVRSKLPGSKPTATDGDKGKDKDGLTKADDTNKKTTGGIS